MIYYVLSYNEVDARREALQQAVSNRLEIPQVSHDLIEYYEKFKEFLIDQHMYSVDVTCVVEKMEDIP